MTDYISSQSQLREQTLIVLQTTPQQEQNINSYMDSLKNVPVGILTDNCSERIAAALRFAGIEVGPIVTPVALKNVLIDVLGDPATVIPQKPSSLPIDLENYNPKEKPKCPK